jgi:uncharacterized protein YdeI (YjbR/CyaY-like superfamily)
MRFMSVDEVTAAFDVVEAYVVEAVRIEDAGVEVGPAPALVLADELQHRVGQDPAFREAFEALTPGRRREYHLYVAGAKQVATRAARVERCAPMILEGKGLRDR